MQNEFTEFENESLETISKIDEWELSTLKSLVKGKMFEGKSFQRAVMLVLSQAKRPVEVDPKKKELLAKVAALRDKMLKEFNEHQAKKAGIIK
jgi:hypothetical protein